MFFSQVTSWLSRNGGGIASVVRSLAGSLQAMSQRIAVVGLEDASYKDDRFSWDGIRTYPCRVHGYKAFGYSPTLTQTILKNSPILVHLHGLWMYPQLSVLNWQKKSNGIVVISPHGMLDSWALNRSRLKKELIRNVYGNRSLRQANCLHALCKEEAIAIREAGLTNPIAVIPNGVALPRTRIDQSQPWDNPHVDCHRKKLLFLSRIHPKKGLINLLNAYNIVTKGNLLRKEQIWQLIIAGWDQESHQAELVGYVKKRGLERDVCFVGAPYGDR